MPMAVSQFYFRGVVCRATPPGGRVGESSCAPAKAPVGGVNVRVSVDLIEKGF